MAIAFIANNDNMRTLVDHINGKKNDNRVENLRWASSLENNTNAAVRQDSPLGIRGVTLDKSGKYIARITVNGCTRVIGRYDTKEEAAQNRFAFAHESYGECMNSCERVRSSRFVYCEQVDVPALEYIA